MAISVWFTMGVLDKYAKQETAIRQYEEKRPWAVWKDPLDKCLEDWKFRGAAEGKGEWYIGIVSGDCWYQYKRQA